MKRQRSTTLFGKTLIAALVTHASLAIAQDAPEEFSLVNSVKAGLTSSPRLASEVHGFEAAIEDSNVVFGDLLPTVDLRAAAGREHSKIKNGASDSYDNTSYGIEARQNLFNGFASQTRYLGSHSDAMARYYDVLDQTNEIALEAATAHANVSRFQALTRLAEANVNYHKEIMTRIEEKVSNGVSRPADLEQARSRYTLALTNLATEKANTFTAMADYQRITENIWPVNETGKYVIETNFEIANPERLVFALNNHQLLRAANARIYAANYRVTASKEGFFPRLDLRAKSDVYSNYLSNDQERQISSIDLLASYNLYRGGADQATKKAAIKRKHQALDRRLLVCKAIRRNTQVALYDVLNMRKRLNYFQEQAQAISNARDAYEQQFQIGRRDLLDLLNAENEYFQAQRNLISVEADLSISRLRLLSASGQLVGLFGVEDLLEVDEPTRRNVILYQDQIAESGQETSCPKSLIGLETFELPTIGFEPALKGVFNHQKLPGVPKSQELGNVDSIGGDQAGTHSQPTPEEVGQTTAPKSKADELSQGEASPAFRPIELAQLGGVVPLSESLAFLSKTSAQLVAVDMNSVDPAMVSSVLIELTRSWAEAWETGDVTSYIEFYSNEFQPSRGSLNQWRETRKVRLSRAKDLSIDISDIRVIPSFEDANVYEVIFEQDYSASHYKEVSRKVLVWKKHPDGQWRIIFEKNNPKHTAKSSSNSKGVSSGIEGVSSGIA